MPRQMRIEYAGAIYHVISRGDRREAIFLDQGDCRDFLKTLDEACAKTGCAVHAFCLMKNHFHLVIETPQGNLVAAMRWLLSTYSNRFNHRHRLCGHLFSGRYKALVIDGGGDGYLRTACDYTHLNPARAKLLGPESRLRDYPGSSFAAYVAEPSQRPQWLRVEPLLGEHGIAQDTTDGRREFERRMESRRAQEGDPEQWKGMRRGWCLGSEPFKRGLMERLQGKLGTNYAGEMRRQADQARAEVIIETELKRLHWTQADFGFRAKTDPGRLFVAARLRRETTLTIQQIAERLRMGSRKSVAPKLQDWIKTHE